MRRRCFTLIEILAVLMILALISGLAVTSLRNTPVFVTMNQVVDDLKNECAAARQTATCRNVTLKIRFNPETNQILSDENTIDVPDGMILRVGERELGTEKEPYDLFAFFPDGSGEEQKLTIDYKGERTEIFLSPLTGRITSQNVKME